MKKRLVVYGCIIFSAFFLVTTSYAEPIFFLTEGYKNGGADVNGDKKFQNSFASGTAFVEEDFNNFVHDDPITSQTYGDVTVDFSLTDNWNAQTARIHDGWWNWATGSSQGIYGVLSGKAVKNMLSPGISFDFTGKDVVTGFGVWIMDDGSHHRDAFTMTVTDLQGNSWVSPKLDADPGTGDEVIFEGAGDGYKHVIDGFLAVHLEEGIKSVTINEVLTPKSSFIFDHMQIYSKPAPEPVPEPATGILFALGLLGFAQLKKRWNR